MLHWGLPHYNSLLIWCKVNKVLDEEILLLGVREYAVALLQHHSTSTMTRYVRCCRQRTHCGHPRSKTRPSFKDIHLFTLLLLPILLANLQSAISNCTPNLNPNTDYELIDFNNAANHFFVGHSTQHLTLSFYIPKEWWTLPIIKSVDLINNQLMSKFNYLINCYLCSNCSC